MKIPEIRSFLILYKNFCIIYIQGKDKRNIQNLIILIAKKERNMFRMPNRQKDFLFDALIGGMDKAMQATLRQMYHISRTNDEFIHRQEMEELKKEVAEYVISHITATLDVSEIVDQIEELRQSIDSLGK